MCYTVIIYILSTRNIINILWRVPSHVRACRRRINVLGIRIDRKDLTRLLTI